MKKSVFVRLHENALERVKNKKDIQLQQGAKEAIECMKKVEMSSHSRALAANRGKGEFSNYGEKLYMEDKLRRERREKHLELIKRLQEEEEKKHLTFQPTIRYISFKTIINKKKSEVAKKVRGSNVFDRVQEYIASRSEKRRKLVYTKVYLE